VTYRFAWDLANPALRLTYRKLALPGRAAALDVGAVVTAGLSSHPLLRARRGTAFPWLQTSSEEAEKNDEVDNKYSNETQSKSPEKNWFDVEVLADYADRQWYPLVIRSCRHGHIISFTPCAATQAPLAGIRCRVNAVAWLAWNLES